MYYYQSPQQMQQMPVMSQALKGRPVSSLEEARAAQIDFDGSLFIFPDIANKKIYTKQIGMDGMLNLNMYELKPIQDLIISNQNYVTKDEFERVINDLKNSLQENKQTQNF